MNSTTVAGRIGRTNGLRKTQSGQSVLGFTIAEDIYAGGNKRTQWWDCTIWGKRAEALADLIHKGGQVTVTGQAVMETYEHNGETKSKMTIPSVNDLALQGGSGKSGQSGQPSTPTVGDDDIPF